MRLARIAVPFCTFTLAAGTLAADTVGDEFHVHVVTTLSQSSPDVGRLPGGRFVVAWSQEDDFYTAPPGGPRARVFGPDGTPLTGEIEVHEEWLPAQGVAVSPGPGGGFIVVWDKEPAWSIRGRRYDAAGAPVGGSFIVPTTADDYPDEADVAGTGTGAFVVAWDHAADGGGYDIRARTFDAAGTRDGGATWTMVVAGFGADNLPARPTPGTRTTPCSNGRPRAPPRRTRSCA